MDTFIFTLIVAFAVVLIAVGLLAISWLITGKSKIRPGACGRDPTKLRNENCDDNSNISCSLCKKEEKGKK